MTDLERFHGYLEAADGMKELPNIRPKFIHKPI